MKKILMLIIAITSMIFAYAGTTKDHVAAYAGDGYGVEFLCFKDSDDGGYIVAFKTHVKVGIPPNNNRPVILIQNPDNDNDFIRAKVNLYQINDDGTYVYDISYDDAIVRFFKRVNYAWVGYFNSTGGNYASDTFSLNGFTKAINSIK